MDRNYNEVLSKIMIYRIMNHDFNKYRKNSLLTNPDVCLINSLLSEQTKG